MIGGINKHDDGAHQVDHDSKNPHANKTIYIYTNQQHDK